MPVGKHNLVQSPYTMLGRRGYSPSVSLNFLLGSLDPRITFTRASVGTYINSTGVGSTAAVDVPRFDYNLSNLQPRGLLVEGTRTNVFLNSATPATQNITVTAQAYTLSFYGTGTITLSGVFVGSLVGTGAANRVTLTFTPTAGTLTLTVSGSVAATQLEAGGFASSYIATTGTAATRATDLVSLTGTNFSSWFNPVAGTILWHLNDINPMGILGGFAETFSDTVYVGAVSGTVSVQSGGVNQATLSPGALVAGDKLAVSYASNDFKSVRNGGTVLTDVAGAVPVAPIRFKIGSEPWAVGATSPTFARIARIQYWPRSFSSSELQALTS